MDTNVNYKFYKSSTGTYQVLPGANIAPGSGLNEVTFDEFKQGAKAQGSNSIDLTPGGQSRYDWFLSGGAGVDPNSAAAIRAAEQGQAKSFGQVDPQGNLIGNEAIAAEASHKANVANGTEKIASTQNGVNIYQPTGTVAPFVQGTQGQVPQVTSQNAPQTPQTQQQTFTDKNGQTIALNQATGRYDYVQSQGTQNGQSGGQPETFTGPDGKTLYLDKNTGRYEYSPSTASTGGTTQSQTGQTGEVAQPETQNGKTPTQNIIDTYNEVYKQLGLGTIKSQYETAVSEEAKVQNELNDKIAEVNNNPWLSEGARSKGIQGLQSKYETKVSIAQNKVKLLDALYQEGQAQAQFMVGQVEQDQRQAMTIAQQKAEALAKLSDKSLSDIFGTGSIGEYNFAKAQGYKGSFTDYQNEDANRKAKATGSGVGGMLSSAQMNSTINQIVGSFDNEQTVKDYNIVKTTIDALKNAGSSPTDDIQRIYAFAKIMDPNSVVREGEYKTVQDYSTALLQRAGINLARAFDARGFLTPDARDAMSKTLGNVLTAKQYAYKQLQDQYQNRINQVQGGGFNSLTNYSTGYGGNTAPAASKFDYLSSSLTTDDAKKVAYLPRAQWDQVKGADKDALLAEIKADGYTLLIK
jgi:hypothetical protein